MTEHDADTAGAGSPAPAVPSVGVPPVRAPATRVDLVPEDVRRELDRIRTRWGQLDVERAAAALPVVRTVLDDLAARTSVGGATVPDLGPRVVLDQLGAVTWDACAAGRGDGIAEALAGLRRALP